MKEQSLCRKCVLPESALFKLDDNGVCELCNSPELLKHIVKKPDVEELNNIIGRIRQSGKNQEYDCVVAWSGGRDSTFLLYELVTKHKLRCVAVFGKTPFTPVEIINNVRSISKRLNITLIEIETLSNHLKIANYCINEYLKTAMPILINLACAPCKFVNREIFKQAKKLGIKTVIYGGNRFEYFPSGPASIDLTTENRYSFITMLKDNYLRLVKGINVLFNSRALLKYLFTFFKASILYVNQYTIFLRIKYPGIFRFDYYHFADWDEKIIEETLHNLGWKLPKGCNSTWRADCVFEAIKNTAFKKSLGFTYAQAMYSNLIRGGKISKEYAIKKLEKEGISEPRLHEALKLCGLPEDIFEQEKEYKESRSDKRDVPQAQTANSRNTP